MDPNSIFGGPVLWGSALWDLGAAWLLNYLLHSTLLLGAVWILSRIRVLSPAFQDVFWKAALVGGIVTAGAHTLGMGGEPLGGRWTVESASPAIPETLVLHGGERSEAPVAVFIPEAIETPASSSVRSLPSWLNRVRTGALQGWPQAMIMAWVLGGALCLARLFWLRYRLGRRLRSRTEITRGPLADLFRRMCARLDLDRRVRLTVSDRVGGPLAWGRSEICLPRRALVDLTPEQQQNVLAHELAHLVRRDPTWRWFGALVEAVFFFQPLNRKARRGIHEAAEYLCDDWAVGMTGQNLVMAKCLVEVAGWLRPLPTPAPAAGMAEQGSPLVRRVERLVRRDPSSSGLPARWPILAALALVAATAWFSPGFVPEARRSGSDILTAGLHPEDDSNVWVQDPFLMESPERGGLFGLSGFSGGPGIPSGHGRPSSLEFPGTEARPPDPAEAAPAAPRKLESLPTPAPPHSVRWEWKAVPRSRPAQVLAQVNHVQLPEDIERHLELLEQHLNEDARPHVREWRRLLRESLNLQIQISETGMELQIQPERPEAPVPGKVVEIPVVRIQELLERQAKQLRQNRHQVQRVREVIQRQVERQKSTARFTWLVI